MRFLWTDKKLRDSSKITSHNLSAKNPKIRDILQTKCELIFEPTLNKIIPFIFFVLCVFTPSAILSAGYDGEKILNTQLYSPSELKKKITNYSKEIIAINNQIKAQKSDITWLKLKINQIVDSGRKPFIKQKQVLLKKQKKVDALLKGRERINHLVQSYSTALALRKKEIKPMDKGPGDQIDANDADIQKAKIQAAIEQSGLGDWVEMVGAGTCLRIETVLPILFPTGSAKVAKEYKTFFKKLAGLLKPFDVKIFVKGYADIVPIHNKKYPSNFELGAIRAANIVHQLVNYGVKPSIFKIESSGKYRFSAKGTVKQKFIERRAELTIVFSG